MRIFFYFSSRTFCCQQVFTRITQMDQPRLIFQWLVKNDRWSIIGCCLILHWYVNVDNSIYIYMERICAMNSDFAHIIRESFMFMLDDQNNTTAIVPNQFPATTNGTQSSQFHRIITTEDIYIDISHWNKLYQRHHLMNTTTDYRIIVLLCVVKVKQTRSIAMRHR